MDFIKRHYEKLLLLCMLLLFISIMIYVMQVAEKARSITDDKLRIPTFEADYEKKREKPGDSKFNRELVVQINKSHWSVSSQRQLFDSKGKSIEDTFSDLVVAMRISTCPHCSNLVPRYYFSDKLCPACGQELKTPPPKPKERRYVITENDLDGDGMPNTYETSKGFDPKNPDDQRADADNDGFSNLYEYENNTDPKNASDRPPLWYRLRYISMQSVDLPIRLMAVNTMDSKDKTMWNIQLNKHRVNRRTGRVMIDPRTRMPREETINQRIGDVITIEDVDYKITEVDYKLRRINNDKTQEESTIKVVQVVKPDAQGKTPVADVLVMQVGKTVKSNDKRLIVEDIGVEHNRPTYVLRQKGMLTLGTRFTRRESYRLESVNEKSRTAVFHRVGVNIADPSKDRNGKKILVTRDSEIPEDVQVKAVRLKKESEIDDRRGR